MQRILGRNLHFGPRISRSKIFFSLGNKRFYSTQQEAARQMRLARLALINSVDGFMARNMLRLRLFLMGQVRPMRSDDVLALFSWVFVGNTLFVLVGTTSFVSIALMLVNSSPFQDKLGDYLSRSLTEQTGWEIKFESAIVPRWRDGMIRLSNVSAVLNAETWRERKRLEHILNGSVEPFDPSSVDTNYTYWDLTIDSIDITLSLWRWMDGRGIVQDARFKGVRGDSIRSHIVWNDDWVPTRRAREFGDFDLENVTVEDLMITVHNPNFRPFTFSIFKGKAPRIRKQWVLYDIMCADNIVGMVDNCLFSLHQPQIKSASEDKESKWSKIRHFKLNGLPIAHVNNFAQGPFKWITQGTFDIDMHLLLPHSDQGDVFEQLFTEIDTAKRDVMEKFEQVVAEHQVAASNISPLQHIHTYPHTERPTANAASLKSDILCRTKRLGQNLGSKRTENKLTMHTRIQINDLKASVPLSTPQLSYMNQALIRPVVAFMNANRTRIPVTCTIQMDVDNFSGAWDIFTAGLVDILAEEFGRSIVALMQDEKERSRRFKEFTLWSLSELSKSLMSVMENTALWNEYAYN